MDFENLSPELREKAKACTSPEELEKKEKKENLEISLDELDSASGGTGECPGNCTWVCLRLGPCVEGDMREDIDPSRVHADFVNGSLNGGKYF